VTPYHSQVHVVNGKIFTWSFYESCGKFLVVVDDGERKENGGEWRSMDQAAEWAELLCSEQRASTLTDPLIEYRGKSHVILVTRDEFDGRWAIVVGNRKNGRYDDSGLRFLDEGEARRVARG
jgi:hypothetical protein